MNNSLLFMISMVKIRNNYLQSDSENKKNNDMDTLFERSMAESVQGIRKLMRKEKFELFKSIEDDLNINSLESLIDFINNQSVTTFLFGKVPDCGIDENDIIYPKRSTNGSAGYDIFSTETFTLKPGESKIVKTGLNVLLGWNMVLMIYPRSGLGFKYKVQLANTVGIIDSDYILSDNYGHIMIKLVNDGDKDLTIKKGDAFAQAVCTDYFISDDDETVEKAIRNGGFGSTG